MSKAVVLFADGTEECEALLVVEIYAEATKEAKAHSFANLNGKLGISV